MEPQKPWLFVPGPESAQVTGRKSWLPPVVGSHLGLWQVRSRVGVARRAEVHGGNGPCCPVTAR